LEFITQPLTLPFFPKKYTKVVNVLYIVNHHSVDAFEKHPHRKHLGALFIHSLRTRISSCKCQGETDLDSL